MKIVIVVDMIKGFYKNGSLAGSISEKLISEVLKKLKGYPKQNIIFVRDGHSANSVEFNQFPVHCIMGTEENLLVDELKDYEGKVKNFNKNSTNAIFADGFIEYILELNPTDIELVGCCTDICIMNLAISLKTFYNQNNKDVNIIVDTTLVDTYNSPDHNKEEYTRAALMVMKLNGIIIINGSEIL